MLGVQLRLFYPGWNEFLADSLMTKATAAEVAGVSIRTLNRWILDDAVIPNSIFEFVGIESPPLRRYKKAMLGNYRGYVWLAAKTDKVGYAVPDDAEPFVDIPVGRIVAFWD